MIYENWALPALKAQPTVGTEWIIEPIVAPDSTSIIFGPREAGKTQLILSLFRAIQEQTLCFGHYPCRRVKAALVEIDMPRVLLQRRLQDMPYAFDPDLFLVQTFQHAPNIFHCTPTTDWVRDLNAFAPEWIVFDSLRKLHHLKDEAPEAPSLVYNKLRELFPNRARSVLHHVKKAPPSYLLNGSGYKQSEDPDAYRGTTAWLDDADAAVYMPYNTKTRERAVWLTRSRLVSEDVKSHPISVRLDEESLFLEAAAPSPQVQLVGWSAEHLHASPAEAVDFLKQIAPGKSRATYWRWARQAGFTASQSQSR